MAQSALRMAEQAIGAPSDVAREKPTKRSRYVNEAPKPRVRPNKNPPGM